MAYEDWVDTQPQRYGSKPYPMVSEDGDIYGWVGDGWYYMDENGMLVGGRHPSEAACRANRDLIIQRRADRANENAQGPK